MDNNDRADLTVAALADSFLESDDFTVEQRSYLVESTLPSVVLCVEKLLREVERRGESQPQQPQQPQAGSAATLPAKLNAPDGKFNPVNWLAQQLFRSNPKYVDTTNTTSPYYDRLGNVATALQERIFEIEATKRAHRRGEAQRKRRENEQLQRNFAAALLESYREKAKLLKGTFESWTRKLWRDESAFLYHSELIKAIDFVQNIQKTTQKEGFKELADVIKSEASIDPQALIAKYADKYGREIPWHEPETRVAYEKEALIKALAAPLLKLGGTASDVTAAIEGTFKVTKNVRWSLADFVRGFLCLVGYWTLDELQSLTTLITMYLDEECTKLDAEYSTFVVLPVFEDFDFVGAPEKWKARLKGFSDDFAYVDEDQRNHGSTARKIVYEAVSLVTSGNLDFEYARMVRRIGNECGIGAARAWVDYAVKRAANDKKDQKKAGGAAGDPESAARLQALLEQAKKDGRRRELNADQKKDRSAKIDKLFPLIDKKNFGVVLARAVNTFLETLGAHPSLAIVHQVAFHAAKIPTTSRTSMTKKINLKEFVQHFSEALNDLTDSQFNDAIKILTAAFSEQDLDAFFKGHKAAPAFSWPEIADQLWAEVSQAISHNQLAIPEIADLVMGKVLDAVSKAHTNDKFFGGLALCEDIFVKDSSGKPEGEVKRFLRVLYSSNVARLGKTVASGEPLYDIATKSAARTAVNGDYSENDVTGKIVAAQLSYPPASASSSSQQTDGYGVLYVYSAVSNPIFSQEEADFLTNIGQRFMHQVQKLDEQNQIMVFAESSIKWAESVGDVSVDFYLGGEQRNLLKYTRVAAEQQQQQPAPADQGVYISPYFTHATAKFTAVTEDSEFTKALAQVAAELKEVKYTDPQTKMTTTIAPILDSSKKIAGIVTLRPRNKSDASIKAYELQEFHKIAKVLETGITAIRRESHPPVGEAFADPDRVHLAGENLDEQTRRECMFHKLLLLTCRDGLSHLDANAIAEIKSYKKPPKLVHQVIKSVLYLFGKARKDVATWSSAVKFVNADLLKTMIAYDPTSIQKKAFFRRVRKVVKKIPFDDVESRASMPTRVMFEWLLVSLKLREDAVEARKRRADVFSQSGETVENDEDSGDDEDEDLGSDEDPTSPGGQDTVVSTLLERVSSIENVDKVIGSRTTSRENLRKSRSIDNMKKSGSQSSVRSNGGRASPRSGAHSRASSSEKVNAEGRQKAIDVKDHYKKSLSNLRERLASNEELREEESKQ